MLQILSGKQRSFGLLFSMLRLLPVLVVLLLCADQAQAQAAGWCSRVKPLAPIGGWSMAPSGTAFRNGDVVGRVSAGVSFFMRLSGGNIMNVRAKDMPPVSNPYYAVPLKGAPGLGLAVRWGGHTATANLQYSRETAVGTLISGKGQVEILRGTTQTDYTLTQTYNLELIVIDARLYKGGTLMPGETERVEFTTSNKAGLMGNEVICDNGGVNLMYALTGSLQVPPLPVPALPSCNFSSSTLHQSLPLGPVDPNQVAPQGSARAAGIAGQNVFSIVGSECVEGTVVQVYFTDARSGSSLRDHLISSNPGVGVRMYFMDKTNPTMFGPAPSGAWIPAGYQPETVGPAVHGGVLALLFTAQYVRRSGISVSDVVPGPVNAEAVFTIVYP